MILALQVCPRALRGWRAGVFTRGRVGMVDPLRTPFFEACPMEGQLWKYAVGEERRRYAHGLDVFFDFIFLGGRGWGWGKSLAIDFSPFTKISTTPSSPRPTWVTKIHQDAMLAHGFFFSMVAGRGTNTLRSTRQYSAARTLPRRTAAQLYMSANSGGVLTSPALHGHTQWGRGFIWGSFFEMDETFMRNLEHTISIFEML